MCLFRGWSYVTITHDTLDISPYRDQCPRAGSNFFQLGNHCIGDSQPHPPLFIMHHVRLASGWLASYRNAFLFVLLCAVTEEINYDTRTLTTCSFSTRNLTWGSSESFLLTWGLREGDAAILLSELTSADSSENCCCSSIRKQTETA